MALFMDIEIVILSLFVFKIECLRKTHKNIIRIFRLILEGKAQVGH
jgi:hypothetical protein